MAERIVVFKPVGTGITNQRFISVESYRDSDKNVLPWVGGILFLHHSGYWHLKLRSTDTPIDHLVSQKTPEFLASEGMTPIQWATQYIQELDK